MVRGLLGRLVARIAAFWDLPESAERIEGSGEAYLEPAYNGRYRAERELEELAAADEGEGRDVAGSVDPVHLER